MKKIFFLMVLLFIACFFTYAGNLTDTTATPSDSIRKKLGFEFEKPFIGWELLGPSNLIALTYQQQFMRLGKKSYIDIQMLINNRNILLEKYTEWDPEYDQQNYRTNKFAIYLVQRNSIFKRFGISIGLGYLHFQEWGYDIVREGWDNHISKVYYSSAQNDFVIFKGTLSVNLSRNLLLSLNVNHIFDNHKALIPYMDLKDNNYSLTILFGFNKKDPKANEEKIYGFIKNQLFFNATKLQLGYERFLLNRPDYNVSASIATHAIPFKRYGEYSNKKGYETLTDAMVNFNYSLGAKTYSFMGIGGSYNYITYYVLDDMYHMQTYGLRSNIGVAVKLTNNLSLKLAYTPYIIKNFDINIENMEYFKFFRQYKLNAMISYGFGK